MSTGASDLGMVDRALGTDAPLPRDNGELVFDEPWQGRALGMGVVAMDRAGASWSDFRRHLAVAIAARASSESESEFESESESESDATAYYAAWLDALEALLVERGLLD
jgi:nitrile hydratase accessory protein